MVLFLKHLPPNRKEKTNKYNTKCHFCLHGKITRRNVFLGTTNENNGFLLPKPRPLVMLRHKYKRPVLSWVAMRNSDHIRQKSIRRD